MTPEQLAFERGKSLAHEAFILALAIQLVRTGEQKENIAHIAHVLLHAFPKADSAEAQMAFKLGHERLGQMCHVFISNGEG